MASKEVADRLKAGDVVTSVLDSAKERIAAGMEATFQAPRQATLALVTSVVTGLTAARTKLGLADEAHSEELADDAPSRKARDAGVREVQKWIPKIRSDVQTHHGEEGSRELGIDGLTPDDGQLLVQYANPILSKLQKWRPRPSDLGGDEAFDAARWASRLKKAIGALEEALAAVASEVGEAKVTLTARLAATEEFDATFAGAANIATALLRAVGERELADRVRPSARRPGRTIDQDDEAPADPLQPTG